MEIPAIINGNPAFETLVPINQPTLPAVKELIPGLEDMFSSKMITNNVYVKRFEQECASYLGVKHAIAVSSCTSGLLISIANLGLTGEVIVPSFTFPATVHVLAWNNLKPVFIDCDAETFNLDVDLIEQAITPRTCAIMGVYIFGNPPEMNKLERLAAKHGLKLIFDAAHAFGTKYDGKMAGNFGDAEVFSLAPTKLIVSGEGGIIATNNDELASKLKLAREYGNPGNYNCRMIGLNARMSEIHALLGIKSLNILEDNIQKRYALVDLYKSKLQGIPGIGFQKISLGVRTTFNYFPILLNDMEFGLTNDELALSLKAENIMTRKYFFPPVHEQDAYADYFAQYKDKLPVTEQVCSKICCLPLYSHMERETVEKICQSIGMIHTFGQEVKAKLAHAN